MSMAKWEMEDAGANYRAFSERLLNNDRDEVSNGQVIELLPRGECDGWLAFAASFWILTYLQTHPRGQSFRPAPPFLLSTDPLTIRVPDVAYIDAHRLAEHPWPGTGSWPIAPDLILEVISNDERQTEVEGRIAEFFNAGTAVAWVLDARDKTCEVRRRRGASRVFTYHQKVFSAPVLPRFNFHVYELFGE